MRLAYKSKLRKSQIYFIEIIPGLNDTNRISSNQKLSLFGNITRNTSFIPPTSNKLNN